MKAAKFSTPIAALMLVLGACSHPPGAAPPTPGQTQAPIRVTVVAPERGAISRDLSLTATVEAYEQVPLYAKVSGYVRSLAVDIGDRVSAGQLLATLDMPEVKSQYAQVSAALGERRAKMREAQAEAALAQTIFVRGKGLRAKGAITQQEMDEIAAKYQVAKARVEVARSAELSAGAHLAELQALMGYARITAPFDAVVTRRFVDPGALMQAATSNNDVTPLLTVARIDIVRVFVDVPEPSVPYVWCGQPATLEVGATGGRFHGSITRYAGALDPATRTMRTEVDLQNTDRSLRPGMYGKLTMTLRTGAGALGLARSAVHQDDRGAFVFVLQGRRAVERRLRLGLASDQRVEIVAGLDGGERVIGSSADLKDGTAVSVVARADPGPGEAR